MKVNNYPTIPLVMKSFMDAESIPVIPHLIEEVPDFKGFISKFIASDDEALEGHTKAQQFKFYVDSSSIPWMQYKIHCTDGDWLPRDGVGIKLWKEDIAGRPILPSGTSLALIPERMKNLDEIVKGIAGFILYWKNAGAQHNYAVFQWWI